ncbi:MAG: hypothetical protein M1377_05855 [Deltaproteobacteria bacterium]|nr:hypothetical protein [Deltaproteobacteria bacterium]
MRGRSAFTLLTIALVVIALFGIGIVRAQTRTVSWDPVTTYTDGSPIETGNAVTYSVWRQDSVTNAIVQLANRVSVTSATFDDSSLAKGRAYKFWAAAFLATGASSDNSAVYAWTLPLGKAATPAGLAVQ